MSRVLAITFPNSLAAKIPVKVIKMIRRPPSNNLRGLEGVEGEGGKIQQGVREAMMKNFRERSLNGLGKGETALEVKIIPPLHGEEHKYTVIFLEVRFFILWDGMRRIDASNRV